MKKIFVIFLFFSLGYLSSNAQFGIIGKFVDKSIEKADELSDKVIDQIIDETEEEPAKPESESESEASDSKTKETNEEEEDRGRPQPSKGQPGPYLTWAKYDFVPGDELIFEDNQENELNGEFPSRWDLAGNGSVENAGFGGSDVIYFKEASSCIVPFLKNPEKDNLPEIFTIEFDAWFEIDEYCSYLIDFYDHKNQSESTIDIYPLVIEANHAEITRLGDGYYPGTGDNEITTNFWRHIAISFNTRALKVYLDDARVLNIPNLGINPEGLTICCDAMNSVGSEGAGRYIRNIRLAKGGVKLYDKLLQDGKIVTNGIRFDVNKATIKPESMGIMNSIVQLMKEHPELSFSVEGHTDSDGTETDNQLLSEQRARAVADKLIALGIDSKRLTCKGWGESKPLGNNATPEGKANNRRVEFVKI